MRTIPVADLPACCQDLHVQGLSLLFPERLSPEGLEFVKAHGLENLSLEELRSSIEYTSKGEIKIYHRCQHLQDDARCAIYANRPAVCRKFQCSTREDCACGGLGANFDN